MKPSEILKQIKAGSIPVYYGGICYNYHLIHGQCSQDILIKDMVEHGISFEQWEHFSGSVKYPVPARIDLSTAYDTFDKWSKKSNYGQLRWQLLDWLIKQFEAKGV